MPLKHRTETAFLFILALAISFAGFALALLPSMPEGFVYWSILLIASVLYPLLLLHTFKINRADYEFRLLHWFPAILFVLWMVLELLSPFLRIAFILKLGFLSLWSLPLVVLGIVFIILFSLHVIRRSRLRVWVLSLLLALFASSAVASAVMGWNPSLQAALFPRNLSLSPSFPFHFSSLLKFLREDPDSGSGLTIGEHSISASSSSTRSVVAISSATTSSLADHVPDKLPQSGVELFFPLLLLVVAGYCSTLHRRWNRRV